MQKNLQNARDLCFPKSFFSSEVHRTEEKAPWSTAGTVTLRLPGSPPMSRKRFPNSPGFCASRGKNSPEKCVLFFLFHLIFHMLYDIAQEIETWEISVMIRSALQKLLQWKNAPDSNYFCKVFRMQAGISPREFRQKSSGSVSQN